MGISITIYTLTLKIFIISNKRKINKLIKILLYKKNYFSLKFNIIKNKSKNILINYFN